MCVPSSQDPAGQTRTTSVSAQSDPNRAEARPSTSTSQPLPTKEPEATPTPKAEASAAKPEEESEEELSPRSKRREERHAAMERKREEMRNLKHLRTIYSHGRTVRRCLQFATRVLNRYDVSGHSCVW